MALSVFFRDSSEISRREPPCEIGLVITISGTTKTNILENSVVGGKGRAYPGWDKKNGADARLLF